MVGEKRKERIVREGFVFFFILGLCYLWALKGPLSSLQEARRAEIVQEAVKFGYWLIPHLNGEPYVAKPPLFTWVAGGFAWLLGLEEVVLRLPSFLAALGLIFLLLRMGTQVGMSFYQRLLALLILLSAPKFFFFAHRVETDMLQAFFFVLAFYFFWRYLEEGRLGKLYGGYLGAGLAALTKGPFVLFLFPPLLIYGWERHRRRMMRLILCPLGWLLLVGPVGLWYFYVWSSLPPSVFQELLYTDILGRLSTGKRDPFWHYFAALGLATLPWTLVLLYHPLKYFKEALKSPIKPFIWAFLIPVILLSFTAAKYSKYLLPFYPFWALFLAYILSQQTKPFPSSRVLLGAFILSALLVGGALVLEYQSQRLRRESLAAARPYLQLPYPYYAYRAPANYLLVFYHGGPIPVVQSFEELKPPAIVLVETLRGASLPSLPREWQILVEVNPFYKSQRKLVILSWLPSENFSTDEVSVWRGKEASSP